MAATRKYFWLKLRRDFFKRHDTKIIESLENGKDYLLFYLKLLVESIDHDGNLRFSETIPYDPKMLSTITDTNIDIVRSAIKVFTELDMMESLDDGTLFMTQVESMIGRETSDALRMREYRENKKQIVTIQEKGERCSESFENRSPELELELELELEKEEYTPTFETFCKTISEEWNKRNLKPRFRFTTSMGLTTKEREGFATSSNRYTLEEVLEAIGNYAEILGDQKYEAFPKDYGLAGFLLSGVERYITESNPFERCKRKEVEKQEDDEEYWNRIRASAGVDNGR